MSIYTIERRDYEINAPKKACADCKVADLLEQSAKALEGRWGPLTQITFECIYLSGEKVEAAGSAYFIDQDGKAKRHYLKNIPGQTPPASEAKK